MAATRTVRTLGAEATVDFRKQSYSEELEDICVVVDTLGREKEGAQRMLKELKGAEYVSLQPKVLKVIDMAYKYLASFRDFELSGEQYRTLD